MIGIVFIYGPHLHFMFLRQKKMSASARKHLDWKFSIYGPHLHFTFLRQKKMSASARTHPDSPRSYGKGAPLVLTAKGAPLVLTAKGPFPLVLTARRPQQGRGGPL